eukprot:403337473
MPPRQEKRVNEIQGNAERGSKLFKSLCNGCHTSALRGIFGKNIASGNMQYTSGLAAKATEKWTFKNLDLFLAHPKTFAPETAMGAAAVKNARDRRDIIEYLKA